jgi:hypothetical protein
MDFAALLVEKALVQQNLEQDGIMPARDISGLKGRLLQAAFSRRFPGAALRSPYRERSSASTLQLDRSRFATSSAGPTAPRPSRR